MKELRLESAWGWFDYDYVGAFKGLMYRSECRIDLWVKSEVETAVTCGVRVDPEDLTKLALVIVKEHLEHCERMLEIFPPEEYEEDIEICKKLIASAENRRLSETSPRST